MRSIKQFDFRIGTFVPRTPRFRHKLVCEFPYPGSMAIRPPLAPLVFGGFRRADCVEHVFAEDPVMDSDPRSFAKIQVYACAIRRGELSEFEERTGKRLAGPTAAMLLQDAEEGIPTGTVFAGLTRHGIRNGRATWVTLVNVAGPDDPCRIQRKSLAGAAKISYIACVE